MNKTFCYPLLLLVILISASCQKKERTLEDTFKKSVEWMWAQQSEDGGWHSKTHAVLRDGTVLTPYILFQLTQHQDDMSFQIASIDKGIEFIRHSLTLAAVAVSIVLNIIIGLGTTTSSLSSTPDFGPAAIFGYVLLGIWGLATLVPSLALSVRRLHDGNFSGWLLLLLLAVWR